MDGEEDVLEGVLRLLAAAEHVAAEGEQPAVVAVVDRLEGGGVAGAQPLDEPVVAQPAEEPAGGPAATCERK